MAEALLVPGLYAPHLSFGLVSGRVADQFTFVDRVNIPLSTANVESGDVTLTNVDGTQDVTFSGDASLEWSKNSGVWSTGPTTAVTSDTFNLRLDASPNYSTQVSGTMTVGTGGARVSDTYTVTTLTDPATQVSDQDVQININSNVNNPIKRNVNG